MLSDHSLAAGSASTFWALGYHANLPSLSLSSSSLSLSLPFPFLSSSSLYTLQKLISFSLCSFLFVLNIFYFFVLLRLFLAKCFCLQKLCQLCPSAELSFQTPAHKNKTNKAIRKHSDK